MFRRVDGHMAIPESYSNSSECYVGPHQPSRFLSASLFSLALLASSITANAHAKGIFPESDLEFFINEIGIEGRATANAAYSNNIFQDSNLAEVQVFDPIDGITSGAFAHLSKSWQISPELLLSAEAFVGGIDYAEYTGPDYVSTGGSASLQVAMLGGWGKLNANCSWEGEKEQFSIFYHSCGGAVQLGYPIDLFDEPSIRTVILADYSYDDGDGGFFADKERTSFSIAATYSLDRYQFGVMASAANTRFRNPVIPFLIPEKREDTSLTGQFSIQTDVFDSVSAGISFKIDHNHSNIDRHNFWQYNVGPQITWRWL
jgi:hypothetical protein